MPTHRNSASNNLTNPTLVSLDITKYFDTKIGVCTYTSCDIVDILGKTISFITGASLSANSCSFSVSTSSI